MVGVGFPHGDLLELDSRRRIYEEVASRPGAHMRDIERQVGLAIGQVSYHLRTLEDRGLVAHRRDGGFKRFFATRQVDRRHKPWISACRHEAPRHVLVALLVEPGLAQARLVDLLDLAPSTITHHVRRLLDAGLLERGPHGLEVTDPEMARAVLRDCQASFGDPVVDRFVQEDTDVHAPGALQTVVHGSTSDPHS